MIRITGGYLKGRIIDSPGSSVPVRPTTSFFREWIFNVISGTYDISDLKVLDLFAGTGGVSFEFISRGACCAQMIENNPLMFKVLKKNIEKLSLDNASAIKADAFRYLSSILKKKQPLPFNVIFFDPPYINTDIIDSSLELISENPDLMNRDILIIVESSKEYRLKISDDFVIFRDRISGDTKMSLIRRKK